jgi:ubiquinone/menaquinone biosynthesis C-methylase UbiE
MSDKFKTYSNIYNDLYDNYKYNPGEGNKVSIKRMLDESWYKSLPSKWKLLDIGCSSGGFLTLVNDRVNEENVVCELHGVDIAKKAVELANDKGIANCIEGSVTDMNYPDSTFDVIHTSDVLEHLFSKDREPALKEINRILKLDGILFGEVCLTNESDKAFHEDILSKYNLKDLHIDPIIDDEWIQLFKESNFKITYRYTFMRTKNPSGKICRDPKDGFTTGIGQCHLKFTCQKHG